MDYIDINFSVIISSDIYDWVNTSAGGVFVPEGIIRPVVSASALTWFRKHDHCADGCFPEKMGITIDFILRNLLRDYSITVLRF
jgi:hypothetical protein